MTDTYCPDDGASLDVTRDGWLEKATCPTCGYTDTKGGLADTALFRLPPTVRYPVMDFVEVLYRRNPTTPGLSLLRIMAVSAVTWALFLPVNALAALLAAGGVFVFSLGVPHRWGDGDEWGGGEMPAGEGMRVSFADVVLVVLVVRAFAWTAVLEVPEAVRTVAAHPLAYVPALPASPRQLAVATALALMGFYVGGTVGLVVHEHLHWLALRAFGVPARVDYRPTRVLGYPVVITEAETIPEPWTWDAPDWKHAFVGAAPLVMWLPVVGLAVLDAEWPPGMAGVAAAGLLIGWVFTALPSPGDMETIGWGRRRILARLKNTAGGHRAAEGLPRREGER